MSILPIELMEYILLYTDFYTIYDNRDIWKHMHIDYKRLLYLLDYNWEKVVLDSRMDVLEIYSTSDLLSKASKAHDKFLGFTLFKYLYESRRNETMQDITNVIDLAILYENFDILNFTRDVITTETMHEIMYETLSRTNRLSTLDKIKFLYELGVWIENNGMARAWESGHAVWDVLNMSF